MTGQFSIFNFSPSGGSPEGRQFSKSRPSGSILVSTLVFSFIFLILAGGLLGFVSQQRKLSLARQAGLTALQVAEAGLNYYRWHLAHNPNDYADGTGQTGCNPCGPYTHDYTDPSGTVIGQFSLTITPPPLSSTIIKIKSSGWSAVNPQLQRHAVARYGRPSLAAYVVVADADMRFGPGTTIQGPLHSNGGIRFDGIANNVISSARDQYSDPDSDACTVNSWAVHTCVSPADPTPPTAPPVRLDVFAAGREYPVPTIDFGAITVDLGVLKTAAQNAGVHLNQSNQQGWHIQFLGNGTFRYRKVRTTRTCTYGSLPTTVAVGDIFDYQGNWATTNLPANGILFVADNAWVDGTLQSGERVTLVAAKDPLSSGDAIIWINNDVLYATQNGTTALGLIAQKDVSVGLYSEDNLEIDAALLAQTGRVGRSYYPADCNGTYYRRDTITVFGAIATKQRYGFAWSCGGGPPCSGYTNRNLNFDSDLTYAPPPSFPLSGEYQFISWEEISSGESY